MGVNESKFSLINTEFKAENFIRTVLLRMKLQSVEFKDIFEDLRKTVKLTSISFSEGTQKYKQLINNNYVSILDNYSEVQKAVVPTQDNSGQFNSALFFFPIGLCKKENLMSDFKSLLKYINPTITVGHIKAVIKNYLYYFLIELTKVFYNQTLSSEKTVGDFILDDQFKHSMKVIIENIFTQSNFHSFNLTISHDVTSIFHVVKKREFSREVEDHEIFDESMLSILLAKYSFIFSIAELRNYFLRRFSSLEPDSTKFTPDEIDESEKESELFET